MKTFVGEISRAAFYAKYIARGSFAGFGVGLVDLMTEALFLRL